jgi:hypothetical protein
MCFRSCCFRGRLVVTGAAVCALLHTPAVKQQCGLWLFWRRGGNYMCRPGLASGVVGRFLGWLRLSGQSAGRRLVQPDQNPGPRHPAVSPGCVTQPICCQTATVLVCSTHQTSHGVVPGPAADDMCDRHWPLDELCVRAESMWTNSGHPSCDPWCRYPTRFHRPSMSFAF